MYEVGRRALLAAMGVLALKPDRALAQGGDLEASIGETGVPGACGMVVGPEGVRAIRLAGRTRAELAPAGRILATGGRKLFANDRWHIGSNTKAMTALLWARLVERGKLRWDSTVPEMFPDDRVAPAFATVTARDLLSHASGVGDAMIDLGWLLRAHGETGDIRNQRSRFARSLLIRPPDSAAGRYAYANANYMLLGAAIERATGMSWEDAITAELFTPLRLSSAGFGAPPAIGLWGHAEWGGHAEVGGHVEAGGGAEAVGHAGSPGGARRIDPDRDIADNPPVMGPTGRVHIAPGDYARFLSVFLRDGGGYVSPTTLTALLTPAPGVRYAGGWSLGEEGGGRVLTHEGSNTFWYTIATLLPARRTGYVAMVNEGGTRGRDAALAVLARMREGAA